MTDRTFILTSDATDLPLVVTPQALIDFQRQGLEAMNDCLVRLSNRLSPADRREGSALDLVGNMMLDGANAGNTRKVILCALWLAHKHPKITGLVNDGGKFHFVYGDAVKVYEPLPVLACA